MTDIVSAAWVRDHPEVRVVDVRDAWEYEGIGHVPGAVNVPFETYRADEHGAAGGEGEGMLPDEAAFEELMCEAGVGTDDHVVAYDDTHGVFAARLLVTLELFGHDPTKLHLLDGDFSSWQLEHETTTAVPDPDPADYVVDRPAETPLVGAEAVAAAAESGDAVVVDTREEWEYAEGHIPGAVRLDWQELVDEETRGVLPEARAREVLAGRGIVPEQRILLYCNTARRISHTYVVLRDLGFTDLAFYEGSLTEWEREGRPLETGD